MHVSINLCWVVSLDQTTVFHLGRTVSFVNCWYGLQIGAEFIHGSEGSSVKDIADEMGCVLRELNFHILHFNAEIIAIFSAIRVPERNMCGFQRVFRCKSS